MSRRQRRTTRNNIVRALLFAFGASFVSSAASAQTCPAPLEQARRLVLVTATSMMATVGTARLFERASPQDAWKPAALPETVMLGHTGVAWGLGFHPFASDGEPNKAEGDGRTPAGIYPIGVSFGFAASPRPGHIRIVRDTVCVDDPASPAYNSITSRRLVGPKVHGENMRAVRRYRRGLVVDYPTDAQARGGSCIFIHVQRASMAPTEGCVALPEARVAAWQNFSAPGAVLATIPEAALARFAGCLPDPAGR
jgi:L,D-peptidoglycan transpeptidase YkuD (ErfK/YbiS/YcfS/YnhG family)